MSDESHKYSMILKCEAASLRGLWKGEPTEKEIDEGIREIRSKWRIDTQYNMIER